MEERAGCPREWVPPDLQGISHRPNSRQDPNEGVTASSFKYRCVHPQANATPLPEALANFSVVEEEDHVQAAWE
jgi:hypothetical protein